MKWESAIIASLWASVQAAPPSEPRDVGMAKKIPVPHGCSESFNGKFQIIISKKTAKRSSTESSKCTDKGALVMSLQDSKLTDSQNRIGSIASNHQFQFDGPAQPNALATKGWAVCDDSTLALGPIRTFYQCLSGDFHNLYDSNLAKQCEPVTIYVESCEAPDNVGQPRVSQIADGQIQAPTKGAIITKSRDAKVHQSTRAPPPSPTGSPSSGGHIQAPTGLPSRVPRPLPAPSHTPGPKGFVSPKYSPTPTPTPHSPHPSPFSRQPQKPMSTESPSATTSTAPTSKGVKIESHSLATLIVGVVWILMYI